MALTPLMIQYNGIKEKYEDCILFFRMGDFYELFGEDAIVASKILGITLTKRNNGKDGEKELCGFPYHAAERYVPKMVQAGYKVAICEQVEDPKQAKGIVKRDVIEVITAGTTLHDSNLDAKKNNYLAAVYYDESNNDYTLASLDLSTGEFFCTQGNQELILSEIYRLQVSEVVYPSGEGFAGSPIFEDLSSIENIRHTELNELEFDLDRAHDTLCHQFNLKTLEGWGFKKDNSQIAPSGAVLRYTLDLKKQNLDHIRPLIFKPLNDFMLLDPHTQKNLELIDPINRDDQKSTLLSVMDFTYTAVGGRLLRSWITQPLLDAEKIETRQSAVEYLSNDLNLREELKKHFREINDFERLMTRVSTGRINPKEINAIAKSLESAEVCGRLVEECSHPLLYKLFENTQDLSEKYLRIRSVIVDEPPLTVREGKMIRPGANEKLDALNEGIREAREWLANLETSQRELTGIPKLKVGFNKVFGYFLEVSNTHKDKVPDTYIRKQTLSNAERFITPEMKEYESIILNAEGEINQVEYAIYNELRLEIQGWLKEILIISETIAQVDCLLSLSISASKYQWCKPTLHNDERLRVDDAFHPVVVKNNPEIPFIRNDVYLGEDKEKLVLITGPNMAGKSTYLRQTGLVVLMAQIGSYVPAKRAEVGLVDRIFTRVGAADRLSKGQSTFMVEMVETAHILHHATPRSLILLDEIGRGTSTFDGLSLAWALVEELHDNLLKNGKTLFATHYHELTALADDLSNAANYHVTVKDNDGSLVFLRKIVRGASDSSYGIQVAQMAGLPRSVIDRAKEVLSDLEQGETHHTSHAAEDTNHYNEKGQTDLFGPVSVNKDHEKLFKQIEKLDVNNLSPLEALNLLAKLKGKFFN